jgi:aspartyl-tRNA synthetase
MESSKRAPFRENPDGAPGVFIYDRQQPLEGMQAFGYEGVEFLKGLFGGSSSEELLESSITKNPDKHFEEGDLLLVQARRCDPLFGGSTALGLLRNAVYKSAVSSGLIDQDSLHHYLWVTDFPLFTPDNETDPGQGGNAGFSATHHPFTAPKTTKDVDLLLTDPLMAIADHYDLVVNGIELGGGSRRIHNSDMQQFVMRDVLKVRVSRRTFEA